MNPQRMMAPALVLGTLVVALAVAGVPVLSLAPYLIFLLCPLMMFFMMGGRGCPKDRSSRGSRQDQA